MNCKPNQRAIVTRTLGVKDAEHFLGMVFTVRTVEGANFFGPVWSVDPDNKYPAALANLKRGTILAVADATLTPLPDDPDPDAEETKDKEIEHA